MNSPEGQIYIDLYPHSQKATGVEIASSRSFLGQKFLVGKSPEQVLAIIPLMYNICATAHSRAALKSLHQCLHIEADPKIEIARDILVLVEIAKEHLLRIFLDWPKLFGINVSREKITFIGRFGDEFKAALFNQGSAFVLGSTLDTDDSKLKQQIDNLEQKLQELVFSTSTLDWLAHGNPAGLQQWAEQFDTIACRSINRLYMNNRATKGSSNSQHLPQLAESLLLAQFDADNADKFIAQPKYQGRCYETTVLSRQAGHPLIQALCQDSQNGLLARYFARLVELAQIPQQLKILRHKLNSHGLEAPTAELGNNGLARVESARGCLLHRAEIKQGLISKYQILAPTEWNFHPQGVLSQSLARLSTNNRKEHELLAHLIINAIDPCVGYKLRIH